MSQSRTADVFHSLSPLLVLYLALVIIISLLLLRTPVEAAPSHHTPARGLALLAPAVAITTSAPYPTAEQLKAEDERFSAALDALKDRASSQQTLIATLTTLTGLYVVILSFAAYFRLQQTRDESKEAVKANQKAFDDAKSDYTARFDTINDRIADLEQNTRTKVSELQGDSRTKIIDLQSESRTRITTFITEVRNDIPALHGIGRRLEQLLAELETRLPVDGDWTNPDTYDKLSPDDKEQALIDEMVINSLDIFNVTEDVGSRRTVARLYVRLGQFYFARANSLKRTIKDEKENKKPPTIKSDEPRNSLCRGGLYLRKAVSVDYADPVALRARGVILMHNAIWKKEEDNATAHDKDILAHSRLFIDQSLRNDPKEPGALFARAWLLVRDDPPDYAGAIENLTAIIERRDELSTLHRRKFLDLCYLNRANYRAKVLSQGTPTSDQKEDAIESIKKDLEEGMNVAKAARKDPAYRGEIRREIGKDGDLSLVYPELKSTIDPLLTT